MKEIVILCDNEEKDKRLISCLKMLFPECDIRIRSKYTKDLGHTQKKPLHVKTHKSEGV